MATNLYDGPNCANPSSAGDWCGWCAECLAAVRWLNEARRTVFAEVREYETFEYVEARRELEEAR